ncbi:hypothetical protein CkaCkLH20_10577 [Colletotrichum karsti]|uniref:Uncharacterized protein n=1 Tax=Colletotrichum karsti TaxID=1095194 RepID=A0A9P6I4R3_9PEZI|nr:uncharacterized protein CkaCkLH20_10577 [Colletotrichum karsti]KAF9871945.1 hypothetical protein CkaCkLH20_10577 [Colletotrichum karsti]
MQFTTVVSLVAFMAVQATATPLAELSERQTASGCNYFAAPRCCVPTVCQCANGAVYQVNQDNVNAGRHGCDPPWGYIAASNSQFPGYCCRLAEGQVLEGVTGEEALQYLSPDRFDLAKSE